MQERRSLHAPGGTGLSLLQQYGVVTANDWAFPLTDGALRMLVVFHFHALGYSTLEIAFLFLFYELFGVITNLDGGWVGALLMLISVSDSWPKGWSVAYVMVAQAISGIAKDFNKMSAKSAIKTVVPAMPDNPGRGEGQRFQGVVSLGLFLAFPARDGWFVVALPVSLQAALGWRFWEVGGFMGLWVIG